MGATSSSQRFSSSNRTYSNIDDSSTNNPRRSSNATTPLRIVVEVRGGPGSGLAPEGASPQLPEFIFQSPQSGVPLRIFIVPGPGDHILDLMTRLAEAQAAADEAKALRPASKCSVALLPTHTIGPNFTPPPHCTCPVCLDEWEDTQVVCELPCGHIFHEGCILPWLEKSNTCPTCRYPLLTDDTEFNHKVHLAVQERGHPPVPIQCAMKSVGLCECECNSNSPSPCTLRLACGHAFHECCFITSLRSTNQAASDSIEVGCPVRCPYCRTSTTVASKGLSE